MNATLFGHDTLADEIYSAIFGNIDNRHTRIAKLGEIQEWLENGDNVSERSLESLISEWEELDAGDIEFYTS